MCMVLCQISATKVQLKALSSPANFLIYENELVNYLLVPVL